MLYVHDNATRRFGRFVHCVGALLTFGSAVSAYFAFYAPRMNAAEQAYETIAELEQSLQKASSIEREHTRLSGRVREVEDHLQAIHERVPKEARDSEFLSELTRLAEDAGIVITDLSTSSPQKKAVYSQMEISVTCQASYESLCRFIHRLGQLPRLTKIIGFNVRHDRSREGVYPVTITVAIFFHVHGASHQESGHEL